MAKPYNYRIKDLLENIHKHIEAADKSARLPHLAVYAIYDVLVKEVKRYKGHYLCKLLPHEAADQRTSYLGDIQVNSRGDDKAFEVVEIKHKIKLTPELVSSCYDKFKNQPVKTYYLLSTDESLDEAKEIGDLIIKIYNNHGCQMIVNGVFNTMKYYLRLLSDQGKNQFIDKYVELLEQECDYATKMAWESIFSDAKN